MVTSVVNCVVIALVTVWRRFESTSCFPRRIILPNIFSSENWKTTLLVIIAIPVLLRLGFWQLDRAEQKREIQAGFQAQREQAPLTATVLQGYDDIESLAFRRVELEGVYLNQFNVFLDNQIQSGRPGYHLLTPFETKAGYLFWINRGWLPGNADRSLPELPVTTSSSTVVEASVYLPQGESLLLEADVWPDGWPLLVQTVDMQRLVQRMQSDQVFPAELRLERGYAGGLSIDWQAINTLPQKHTGYAVQWFAMAAALFGFWLYILVRGGRDSHR